MNPTTKLDELLASSGAVPVRTKTSKHLLYRLPGGSLHTRPKTPSDPRSVLNNLALLKRKIKAEAAPETPPAEERPKAPVAAAIQPEPEPIVVAVIEEPIPPREPSTPLSARLDELIAAGEEEQNDLMERAEIVTQQLTFLREIRKHADAPHTEALLALLIPQVVAPAAPEPPAPPPPPPPQHTIAITRDAVRAVIRDIPAGRNFTIQDIYARLINGDSHRISKPESARIRGCIATSLKTIFEQEGGLDRINPGGGRRLGVWKKQDPGEIGTRAEV